MNVLTIKNLSKIYPNGVTALDNVDLTLGNGMFGLLGPNGAGKSTLMRAIATLEEPTAGKILFNDIDISVDPQTVRSRLGYLPQEFGVYPKVSAYQLLNHIAVLKGILDKAARREQVMALLDQTNLYPVRKKAVSTFSGGMKQRFGIAQALVGSPSLIIVDEPTAGLDPEERNRFYNLLSEVGEEIIIILSTHIVEDVSNLCSRVAILSEGKLLADAAPKQLVTKLRDEVWCRIVDKDTLDDYRTSFQILSERRVAGKIEMHVLSANKPDSGFHQIVPDLEHVYFSTLFSQSKVVI